MGAGGRRITEVLGNSQWLDGGAMFGNAPKPLWTRWVPADERNRIPLACRAMLVQDGSDRREELRPSPGPHPANVLVETGIGAFFAPDLRDRYGVREDRHVLLESLAALDLTDADLDVVVLSHLHFDHAGGLLSAWEEGEEPRLLFPRATFVVGRKAYERAKHPHFRDRASFVPGLVEGLEATGRLELVDGDTTPSLPGWRFHQSDGHTPGLLLPEVPMPAGPVVFAADLVPGRPWVHLPITMGYDRYPELLIDEKQRLFDDLVARKGRLFYTHDHECAMSGITKEGGKYVPIEPVFHPAGVAA